MKRLLDALIYGIPDRLYVDCSACLFWRGAAFGAALSALLGTLALWLLE